MPEIADRYARHTTALGLAAGHEEAFRSLERILQAEKRFKLVVLRFNDPAYRDAVIAKLAETHPQAATLHVTAAAFPDFSLFEDRLAEVAQRHFIVHLTGLESWLFPLDAPARATGFNYHREAIADHCPAALLLWLTAPDIAQFAVEAPDMWAWRAGVLDFSVDRDDGEIVLMRDGQLEAMSLPQRVKRINEIRSYLASSSNINVSLKALLLDELGTIYHVLGKETEAINCFESSLAIVRQVGDSRNEGATLNNLGETYRALGNNDRALEVFQESLAIFQKVGDQLGENATLNNVALILGAQGKYDEALEIFRQQHVISRKIGDRHSEALALLNIALIFQYQNRLNEALESYREALIISREIGNLHGEAHALNNIAGISYAMGRLSDALTTYLEALAIQREVGWRIGEGKTLSNVAAIYEKLGKHVEALDACLRSLAISSETGDRSGEWSVLWNLGEMLLLSDSKQAQAYYQRSLNIQKDLKDPKYEERLAWFNQQFPPPTPDTSQ